MKKLAVIAGLCVIGTLQAFAADMPLKAKAPVSETFNWTGFYVGANGGYGWGSNVVTSTPDPTVLGGTTPGVVNGGTPITPARFNTDGGSAGLQAGYNIQAGGNWIAGIEADIQWSDFKGSGTSNPFLLVGAPANIQASQAVTWFGTIRGRLGWLAAPNLLLYATGGFAYGDVRNDVALNGTFFTNLVGGVGSSFLCSPGPNCFVGSSSRTAPGWTAGTGVEYAVSRNLTLKAEYLYVSLTGSNTTATALLLQPGQTGPLSNLVAHFGDANFQVVRAGANWKF